MLCQYSGLAGTRWGDRNRLRDWMRDSDIKFIALLQVDVSSFRFAFHDDKVAAALTPDAQQHAVAFDFLA